MSRLTFDPDKRPAPYGDFAEYQDDVLARNPFGKRGDPLSGERRSAGRYVAGWQETPVPLDADYLIWSHGAAVVGWAVGDKLFVVEEVFHTVSYLGQELLRTLGAEGVPS